jgi:hypothetical protein
VFVATGDGGGKPHASLALDQTDRRQSPPSTATATVYPPTRSGTATPTPTAQKVWALGLRNPSDSPSTSRTEHPSSGTSATTDSTRSTLPLKGANLAGSLPRRPPGRLLRPQQPLPLQNALRQPPGRQPAPGPPAHARLGNDRRRRLLLPQLPKTLQNAYFYASWMHGWIRTIQITNHHRIRTTTALRHQPSRPHRHPSRPRRRPLDPLPQLRRPPPHQLPPPLTPRPPPGNGTSSKRRTA